MERIFRRRWPHIVLAALAGMAPQSFAVPGYAQVVERSAAGDPVITEQGRVAGKLLPSGVRAYLGLPYAAPPVGPLRWRSPEAPAAWQGTLNADRSRRSAHRCCVAAT